MVPAAMLLAGILSVYLIADKGYDADSILNLAHSQGQIAVIPPRSNRKVQREYDSHIYKERHLVECFFQKLKSFRRIATRYEKLSITFNSWILIASCLLWFK